MIQQRMNEWILHPESLNAESLQELRSVLEKYPYYQTAWVLYLKNLFLMHDEAFQSELRRGALYVADLSVLFYYIEGDKFVIQKHQDRQLPSEGDDRTLDLIERFLSESPETVQPFQDIPISMEVNMDYTSLLESENPNNSEAEAPPLRGQELIDSFIAQNSTGRTSKRYDTERVIGQAVTDENGTVADVVEIESPEGQEIPEVEDISEDEETVTVSAEEGEDESYFTETLAKIYVKQQRYDKALEIIKKLNLKYPKKNIYFADQIRFLEKLIINAKSK